MPTVDIDADDWNRLLKRVSDLESIVSTLTPKALCGPQELAANALVAQIESQLVHLEGDGVVKRVAPQPPKPQPKKGTRLPEGWQPDAATIDKMRVELNTTGGALEREHRKFTDYYLSAPGQKGVKVDWDRAWCNWMRGASEKGSLRARRTNDDNVRGWMDMDLGPE